LIISWAEEVDGEPGVYLGIAIRYTWLDLVTDLRSEALDRFLDV